MGDGVPRLPASKGERIVKPHEIESLSFRIIDQEAGPHGFGDSEWAIVRRMIHTSADFEYMETTRIHRGAIAAGIRAVRAGRPVFTDTMMARSGIREKEILGFGGTVTCLIQDPRVREKALSDGTTRAQAAVDIALPDADDAIFVIGNAPTALLRLIEHIRAGAVEPALVIGFPVGFVNAAESKAALLDSGATCITNVGRKGGSNVAASVLNALIILATQQDNSSVTQ